ncbi:MAG: anion permease [Desulfobacteraceae bacterium]|nr:anion permease [Desulfobacteraceae bacterium]MDH3572816.1 anion permease [Desulfobacteraceae bacterium]MDH3721416.1 anion permease [Desulfobacteraceae bacterium]MDH3835190.1 anion permease [Desulfobacteraceae bacterium]MDH3874022.1 anion permease [Desulfobacteraceae bacterium]
MTGTFRSVFGLVRTFGDHFYGYQYYPHCRPVSAYGADCPENSASLGISPHVLMMGIAMAESSSFTSPISHPFNVLVMGPGDYSFIDYMKAGVPLTLIVLLVLMVIMPVFWPLTP